MNPADPPEPAAVESGGTALQKCFVCGKTLGNGWFCRIPWQEGRIVLCSPKCMSGYAKRRVRQQAIGSKNLMPMRAVCISSLTEDDHRHES